MRNVKSTTVRNVGFALLTVLLILLAWTSFSTYNAHHEDASSLVSFAAKNHIAIMAGLLVIALAFGFVSSQVLYAEVKREKKGTSNILDIVLKFLSPEEKKIINFLVENDGKTSQAEISRLHGMTRLKAHRSLQRMHGKELIEIIPHGKVRKIQLKESILRTLQEKAPPTDAV